MTTVQCGVISTYYAEGIIERSFTLFFKSHRLVVTYANGDRFALEQ